MIQEHNARVHWRPLKELGWSSLPPQLRSVFISRFQEDGARWPDGSWSVVLFFEEPPSEQVDAAVTPARVAFGFEWSPHERLHAGARFEIYHGLKKIADVDVLD
jgi:hypothetical protein